MNTTVMVALEDDVVAYLDEVLKGRPESTPSEFINQLLRREIEDQGMAQGEMYEKRTDKEQAVEIPGAKGETR